MLLVPAQAYAGELLRCECDEHSQGFPARRYRRASFGGVAVLGGLVVFVVAPPIDVPREAAASSCCVADGRKADRQAGVFVPPSPLPEQTQGWKKPMRRVLHARPPSVGTRREHSPTGTTRTLYVCSCYSKQQQDSSMFALCCQERSRVWSYLQIPTTGVLVKYQLWASHCKTLSIQEVGHAAPNFTQLVGHEI